MNFKIIDNKTFYVKINKSYKKIDLNNPNEIIKKMLILIKKRYSFSVVGFYEVKIFEIKDLITILLFKKINDDSFYNNIDLRIINEVKQIDMKIDDFLILNDNKNIYKFCEWYYFDESNLH